LLESYNHNNSLSIQEYRGTIDDTSRIYQSKVDKIVKEYNEMQKKLNAILLPIKQGAGNTVNVDPRLEPTIINAFNKINTILSAPLNDNIVENDITKYIISNYNAIVLQDDNIYRKKVFMTSNIASVPTNDSNIMTDLFIKLEDQYNKLNILYDKLYQKDLLYYNTNVDKIGAIIADVKIPPTINSDWLTITPENYDISCNIDCLKTCVSSIQKCISENIHCIPTDILDKEKIVYNKIIEYHRLEYKTPIAPKNPDAIKQKETAIKDSQDAITTNLEKIDKNLRSLKIDINNKNKSGTDVSAKKETTSTRKDALAMKDKVQRVNELIYILGLNYVVLFLLPYLIVTYV
jgi:hypothetical protein